MGCSVGGMDACAGRGKEERARLGPFPFWRTPTNRPEALTSVTEIS